MAAGRRPNSPDLRVKTALVRQKAEHLLEGLLEQQREVDANPPDLTPEQMAMGRQALANAIAAARRMLDHLEQAQMLARDADLEIAEEHDEPDEEP